MYTETSIQGRSRNWKFTVHEIERKILQIGDFFELSEYSKMVNAAQRSINNPIMPTEVKLPVRYQNRNKYHPCGSLK